MESPCPESPPSLRSLAVVVATALAVVNAANEALIEGTKTGTSTRILEAQLRNLPTSDRNFKNLVVLTPGSSDVGATGAGAASPSAAR